MIVRCKTLISLDADDADDADDELTLFSGWVFLISIMRDRTRSFSRSPILIMIPILRMAGAIRRNRPVRRLGWAGQPLLR